MWDASDGSLLFTGDNNSSARYCSLNDNGSIAAVGYDDCTLKVRHTGGCTSMYIN